MKMLEFAQQIVQAAHETGNIQILPISVKDLANGCILRFRIGSRY